MPCQTRRRRLHLRLSWSVWQRDTVNGEMQTPPRYRPRDRLRMPLTPKCREKMQKCCKQLQWTEQLCVTVIVTHSARCCRRRLSPRPPRRQRRKRRQRNRHVLVPVPLLCKARAPALALQMLPTRQCVLPQATRPLNCSPHRWCALFPGAHRAAGPAAYSSAPIFRARSFAPRPRKLARRQRPPPPRKPMPVRATWRVRRALCALRSRERRN